MRHLSEQYTTLSQSRSHFLRQANGRLQTGQTFWGRSEGFLPPPIDLFLVSMLLLLCAELLKGVCQHQISGFVSGYVNNQGFI